MNSKEILQSSFLDVLFFRKNKKYGAYELRLNYPKRLLWSVLLVCLTIFMFWLGVFLSDIISRTLKKSKKDFDITVVELSAMNKEEEKILPPPPPKMPEPKVASTRFVKPEITEDENVPKDEVPPEVETLFNTKISTKTQEGITSDVIDAPVEYLEPPPVIEEAPLEKVEVEASFVGGAKAWHKYVEKEVYRHIDELTDAGFTGTVLLKFIVDKDGNVSDVKALTNPHTKLAEVAVNAIKNGPRWIPAIQNGRNVKAYKTQPVTFTVGDE